MEKITQFFSPIKNMFESLGPFSKMVGALLTLIIGWIVINIIVAIVKKILVKKNIDETLRPFIASLALWVLRAALLISVAAIMGVETTSFVAILGAVGFAVGMALQGSLGNIAGGVLLLIFRPFKVGDLIESQGHLGVVKEIQLFTTTLLSPENKTIIIPNGPVSNGDITNYTVEGLIRVDTNVGIGYGADIAQAKAILMDVMNSHPKVLKEPAPFVGVKELADSSVNLLMLPYAKPSDYWAVYFDMHEQAKIALDKASVEIPFPQLDVNLKK